MTESWKGRHTILVVDDVSDNVALLSNLLAGTYRTLVATSGLEALNVARRSPHPDLILLDIVMPNMDGMEVCRQLKADPQTADIPIIFLTAQSDVQDEQAGLDLGAVDYITKPISAALVMARIKTHLHLKATRDFLKSKNEYLANEVGRRTREIAMIQDVTMVAMGSLAETRDTETGAHIHRTQHFMRLLATNARSLPELASQLTEEAVSTLYKSAPLHDIGKVGIPDHILLKPGKLTPEEFEVMKTHTTLGRQAILTAERYLGTSTSFLTIAREITWTHHERWDGLGYPQGLKEEAIPLSGRLMAIADVYDALRTARVYKPAFSHDKATEMIKEGKGTQFDARLVEVFLETASRWDEIYQESHSW